jgi:leucine-rich repeat protein SHOC2
MRTSILITLIIASLLAFLYYSNQLEREIYKEEIALAECEQQFPIVIPRKFTHSNKHYAKVNYYNYGKSIDLGNLDIAGLPDNLFEKSNCIQKVIINNNHIKTLPKAIKSIKNLKELYAFENKIYTIPSDFFSDFSSLSEVNLSRNKLKKFNIKDATIGELNLNSNQLEYFNTQNITINHLDLAVNYLRTFPKGILNIKNLYSLDLRNNQLNDFSSIENDTLLLQSSLNELNLSYNPIIAFPTELRLLPSLSKIDFSSCKIEGTVEIDGFKGLNILNINFQKVKTLLLKENHLAVIDLSNNQISNIVIEGAEAGMKLIVLNLSNNSLKNIPASFRHLSSLQRLNLNATQLIDVSKAFENLPARFSLEHLHLAFNRLQKYPNLAKYSKLRNIDLSQNQFKKLPNPALISNYLLKKVNLSHNLITEFDINAINSSIEVLSLKGNSITKITSRGAIHESIRSNLIKLDLSYNLELEDFDISYLELLPNLQELNLYSTNIKDINRILIEQYCESNDIKVYFDDKEASDNFFKNDLF